MKKNLVSILAAAMSLCMTFSATALPVYATDNNNTANTSAADSEDPKKLYEDGQYYYNLGDYESARQYFSRAILAGSSDAAYRLGVMFLYGYGVTADTNYAIDLFYSAYKAGNPDGLAGLGQALKEAGEYENAYNTYVEAAQSGSIAAVNSLGYMYSTGCYVEKDPAQAVKYYSQAAEAGNKIALNNLGICYKDGKGVEQDLDEAVRLFNKAVEAGNYNGYYNIGVVYEMIEDYEKAIEYYKKAEEKGSVKAMKKLGDACYKGDIAVQNYDAAMRYYEEAAGKGDGYSLFKLGLMTEKGYGTDADPSQAAMYYSQAGENGYPRGYASLGLMYEDNGAFGTNYPLAYHYYLLGDKAGDNVCTHFVGYLYENGLGVDKDLEAAKYYYKKAADAGNKDASNDYARLTASSDSSTQSSSTASSSQSSSSDISASDISDTAGTINEAAGFVGDIAEALDWDGLENLSRKVEKGSGVVSGAAGLFSLIFGD